MIIFYVILFLLSLLGILDLIKLVIMYFLLIININKKLDCLTKYINARNFTLIAVLSLAEVADSGHHAVKLFVYILPAMASPMTVFFMCMYLQASLSYEMIQSARIDGANEFRIFNQIVLPLMKPAAATQAIFAFAASWNDGWMPAITISKMEKKTLLLMFGPIYYLDSQDFLVVIASVIPLLILYAVLSRHIVEGLSLGGLKE